VDVIARPNLWIVVERARRNQHDVASRYLARHRTATDTTERISKSLRVRQAISVHEIFAAKPSECRCRHEQVGGECRAARLAASRAMAVAQLDLLIGLEGHGATQAASLGHREHLRFRLC